MRVCADQRMQGVLSRIRGDELRGKRACPRFALGYGDADLKLPGETARLQRSQGGVATVGGQNFSLEPVAKGSRDAVFRQPETNNRAIHQRACFIRNFNDQGALNPLAFSNNLSVARNDPRFEQAGLRM